MENRLEKIIRRQRRYMREDSITALVMAFTLLAFVAPLV